MKPLSLAAAVAAALALPLAGQAAAAALPQPIAKATASPARSDDAKKDAVRKGPEILAFSEVKPGQKIGDLIPGGGYFTRLFSLTVGASGKAAPRVLPEDEASIAERLVYEGTDEADRERRIAAADPDFDP